MKVASECIRSRWVDGFYLFAASGDGRRVEGVCDNSSWSFALDASALPLERCAVPLETRYSWTSIHVLLIIYWNIYVLTLCSPTASFCDYELSTTISSSRTIVGQHIYTNTNNPYNSFCHIYNKHKKSQHKYTFASWKMIIWITLLQKANPEGMVTESAHPARFSPDDKFSKQRVAIKKRFGIYLPDTKLSKPLWIMQVRSKGGGGG